MIATAEAPPASLKVDRSKAKSCDRLVIAIGIPEQMLGETVEEIRRTEGGVIEVLHYKSVQDACANIRHHLNDFWPPPKFVHPCTLSDMSAADAEELGKFQVHLSSELSLLRGGEVFAQRLSRNLQRNFEHLRVNGARSMFEVVRPEDFCLVVGAGPSLTGHIYGILDTIRAVPDGCLSILVTDRAVETMRHFERFLPRHARVGVVSIEPRPVKSSLMRHVPRGWALIAPLSVHPRTALMYGRSVAWTGIHAGGLLKGLPAVTPSSSVSGQAVQIAVDCQAASIALVGVDSAFRDTTHADGNDPRHVAADKLFVPGIHGYPVLTSDLMNNVRMDLARVMEDAESRGAYPVNCSAWGALIPGAGHCSLREAIRTYCQQIRQQAAAAPLTACVMLHPRSTAGDSMSAIADLSNCIRLARNQNARTA